jgi:hypothetical protein
VELTITFYCLRFENPPIWRVSSPYYIPQEQGGPGILPGTEFPFRRLLRLAGLRWNYSTPLPHGNFGANRTQITTANSSSVILFIRCHGNSRFSLVATVWSSRPYNFQFSYSWKICSVTSWLPRINLSAATYLPIRFLETAHMSQYISS